MVKKTRSKTKHIPQRTCVACRSIYAKRDLTRIVRTAEDGIEVDVTGKRNGRGAYLCRKKSCWDQALKTGALNRALHVTLKPDDIKVLRAYVEVLPDEGSQEQE